jgi:hypothetical protein
MEKEMTEADFANIKGGIQGIELNKQADQSILTQL